MGAFIRRAEVAHGLRHDDVRAVHSLTGMMPHLSRRAGVVAQKISAGRWSKTTIKAMSAGVPQHRDTHDNNESTFFDFTPENYDRVRFGVWGPVGETTFFSGKWTRVAGFV
jgi:hypothetical protein